MSERIETEHGAFIRVDDDRRWIFEDGDQWWSIAPAHADAFDQLLAARRENARLRRTIRFIFDTPYYGCCTGDCPHDTIDECIEGTIELAAQAKEEEG